MGHVANETWSSNIDIHILDIFCCISSVQNGVNIFLCDFFVITLFKPKTTIMRPTKRAQYAMVDIKLPACSGQRHRVPLTKFGPHGLTKAKLDITPATKRAETHVFSFTLNFTSLGTPGSTKLDEILESSNFHKYLRKFESFGLDLSDTSPIC